MRSTSDPGRLAVPVGGAVANRRRAASGQGNSGSFAVEKRSEALDVDLMAARDAAEEWADDDWSDQDEWRDSEPGTNADDAAASWLADALDETPSEAEAALSPEPETYSPIADRPVPENLDVDGIVAGDQDAVLDLVSLARQETTSWVERLQLAKHQRSLEVEDVVQDVTLNLLQQIQRGNGPQKDARKYVSQIARNIVVQQAPPMRAEDRAALKVLDKAQAEFVAEHGRDPNSIEVEQLAARIRTDWHNPRHRPRENFHLQTVQVQVTDIDEATDQDIARAGDSFAPASQATLGPMATKYLDAVESGEARITNKYVMWGAYAEQKGLPPIEVSTIGHRVVTAARSTIASAGGPGPAAASYVPGHDTPTIDAFFAPWNDVTEADKAKLAREFADLPPDRAEILWTVALQTAGARKTSAAPA